jgi:hypothetical protein
LLDRSSSLSKVVRYHHQVNLTSNNCLSALYRIIATPVSSVDERDWTSTRRRTQCSSDSDLDSARLVRGRRPGRSRREKYRVGDFPARSDGIKHLQMRLWQQFLNGPGPSIGSGRPEIRAAHGDSSTDSELRPARKPAVRLLERSNHRHARHYLLLSLGTPITQ